MTFLKFLNAIFPLLTELYMSIVDNKVTSEEELRLAMKLVRKAKDAQAREEIKGL